MNILILGNGAREHAIAYQLRKSPLCNQLFIAPGNAGTKKIAKNLNISSLDFQAIKECVLEEKIEMLIIGPEDPLVNGIKDYFKSDKDLKDILVLGPSMAGAELEGSKKRAKEFMVKYGIPTAKYKSFEPSQLNEGKAFIASLKPPYVLKADGLAAGKGVLIINDLNEAEVALEEMLIQKKFGNASSKVVIEEFMKGIELSVFVLTDGKNHLTFPTAKDYKRIGDNDTGLNTGGMGAVSPPPFVDKAFLKHIEKDIVIPTIKGIQSEKIEYTGFIFIGLMKIDSKAKVVEYNVRLGDPETEVVLPRIENDLVDLFSKACKGELKNINLKIKDDTAATVVAVSGGYPESYEIEKEIKGLDKVKESIVFHAGTKEKNNKIVTNGGRVLAVTSFGENYKEAVKKSYKSLNKLNFDKIYFRNDIGKDL